MTASPVPAPSRRFDAVGFSEIVQVRNRVMALLAAGHKVHRFEGGEPYMATPDAIKRSMEKALARNQTRYAPSSGIPELRSAILEKVRSKNRIPADEEGPIVVNGGMHGLFAAFTTLLDPGDEVITFSPYWTPVVDLVTWNGGVPVLVPTERARTRGITTALAAALTPRAKVLYWNSPNNPTGDVFSPAEVEEVCAFVAGSGLAMISDEAYEDLIYDGTPHVSPASFPGMAERTISVFTLSKSYSMTGWRAGYVIAPERYQSPIRTAVLYSTNGVSTPTQWAALAAFMTSSDFIEAGRAAYRERRDLLVGGLNELDLTCVLPAGAFYAFPDVSGISSNSREAAEILLNRAQVATVPGSVFGPDGEGHVRFSFSTSIETIEGGLESLRRNL